MKVPGAERAHVKLKDLHPNPFRHIESYPIRPEKVEELVRSIKTNKWWNNIHARPREKGGFELAYGHHRLAALRKVYKADDEVQIMVAPLTDEQMLRYMAAENVAEAGGDALTEMHTVGAVIEAHEAGIITLDPPPSKSRTAYIRHAAVNGEDRPYTIASVAAFLSWPYSGYDGDGPGSKSILGADNNRVYIAFDAWELSQQKLLNTSALQQAAPRGYVSREVMGAAVNTARQAREAVRRAITKRESDAADARKGKDERTARQIEAQAERIKKDEKKHVRAAVKEAVHLVASGKKTASQVRRDPPLPKDKLIKRTVSATGWLKTVREFLDKIASYDFFDTEMDHILEVVDDPNIVTPYDRKQLLAAFERALAGINKRWPKHIERLRKVADDHEPRIKNVTPIRRPALTP